MGTSSGADVPVWFGRMLRMGSDQGQKQGQRQQQEPIRGSFAALRMTAKNKQQQRPSENKGKVKSRSRFPEGMTERNAKAKS
jgi:hypothetical protein